MRPYNLDVLAQENRKNGQKNLLKWHLSREALMNKDSKVLLKILKVTVLKMPKEAIKLTR